MAFYQIWLKLANMTFNRCYKVTGKAWQTCACTLRDVPACSQHSFINTAPQETRQRAWTCSACVPSPPCKDEAGSYLCLGTPKTNPLPVMKSLCLAQQKPMLRSEGMAREAFAEATFYTVLPHYKGKVFKLPRVVFQACLKLCSFRQIQPSSQLWAQLCQRGTDLLPPAEIPHAAGWRRPRRGKASAAHCYSSNAHRGAPRTFSQPVGREEMVV